jgi:GNAT superfamily N-acetyltransferase
MAATEPAIVRLNVSDAPGGLVLSTEAHWNQNADDWRFFLQAGRTFGCRDGDGRLIATAALLPHAATDGWISMVLVTERWRRRGLATRLVDHCLAEADALRLTTWLDATPAGATVYGPLGFTGTLELRRLRLTATDRTAASTTGSCRLDDFIALDRAAIGFDRSTLLTELSGRAGSRLVARGEAVALVRDGRGARHIGPLLATNAYAALALVDAIAAADAGQILIDAVASHDDFLAGLGQRGWQLERPFLRMRHGAPAAPAAVSPFAVAGPEYG